MVRVRRSEERGGADHGWLNTKHSFSFGSYLDRNHMGYRSLRVINEDIIRAGEGFGMHPHKDMEIISYVKRGGLEHRDSMGNHSVLRPGEFQRMSAGSGVRHSEFSEAGGEDTHLLQIWILPELEGIEPSYEELSRAGKPGLEVVASYDRRAGSMKIHQDVILFRGILSAGEAVTHPLEVERGAYLQLVEGSCELNGQTLKSGDGAVVEEEGLNLLALTDVEFLLFDLG